MTCLVIQKKNKMRSLFPDVREQREAQRLSHEYLDLGSLGVKGRLDLATCKYKARQLGCKLHLTACRSKGGPSSPASELVGIGPSLTL